MAMSATVIRERCARRGAKMFLMTVLRAGNAKESMPTRSPCNSKSTKMRERQHAHHACADASFSKFFAINDAATAR